MDDDREFGAGCLLAIGLSAVFWGTIVFAFLACRS
jgi:hypothetical protein